MVEIQNKKNIFKQMDTSVIQINTHYNILQITINIGNYISIYKHAYSIYYL